MGLLGSLKKMPILKETSKKISIISEQGQDISTYGVTTNKLRRILKDGFWIWKNRNI
jgi:hypothetical protein